MLKNLFILKKLKKVWMYYLWGTGGSQTLHVDRLTTWQQFSAWSKWRHGRHLETVTSNRKSDSVNRCGFNWGSQISSRSDLKRWSI